MKCPNRIDPQDIFDSDFARGWDQWARDMSEQRRLFAEHLRSRIEQEMAEVEEDDEEDDD